MKLGTSDFSEILQYVLHITGASLKSYGPLINLWGEGVLRGFCLSRNLTFDEYWAGITYLREFLEV